MKLPAPLTCRRMGFFFLGVWVRRTPRRIASVTGGLKDAAQLMIMSCVELSSSIVLSSEKVPCTMAMSRLVRALSRAVLRRKAVRLYCGYCFRNTVRKAPVPSFSVRVV